MTPEQFVIWLKGFADAINTFDIQPEQWEMVLNELGQVETITNKKYTTFINDNTSVGILNLSSKNTSVTYGRPEDTVTYTTTEGAPIF